MKKPFLAALLSAFLVGSLTPSMAHEPGTYESPIVEKRVKRFKQAGADIQAVFKKHLPKSDFEAIEEAALRMAAWGEEMPDAFPVGSTSVGVKSALWTNFLDFKMKAAQHVAAARQLKAVAGSKDPKKVAEAAKRVGGTCKSCHQSYRIKH